MPYADKNRRREDVRIRQQGYRDKARQFITEYKAACGCLVCGEREPVALDFHHLDPAQKDLNISRLVRHRTISNLDSIQAEMEKCVVLCANCHRKVHAGLLTM